ncbi:MAG: hypothetical protein KatS3mg023_1460 [Armatimonadota bacterium]|nr:MAG: hypothetical protein KatS3mg023_1460 [Armatimonadota bacterium]
MQKTAATAPSETVQRTGETVAAISPVRPRALVVGFVGIVILCVIVSAGELIAKNIQIGMMQLAPALVGVLFLLVAGNQLLGRVFPRAKLTPAELAIAFILMIPAPLIASRGLMERWLPLLVGVNYYAPGNNWDVLFFPHVPRALVPWDPDKGARQDVAVWFYERLPAGVPLPWAQWIAPLLVWLILILAVYFAFFCMTVILRKHWVEGEKLSFPLVQLPLEMMLQPQSFLRNRLMWAGFAVSFGLFLVNGLHQWIPTVPEVTLSIQLNPLFTQRPWNQLTYWAIWISPAAIGFFYLMPTDLLFSFWFFYLLGKLQELIAGMYTDNIPFEHAAFSAHVAYQGTGAFVMLAILTLYSARHHLRHVWLRATGAVPPDEAENREMFSYRVAVWGLVASLLVILLWAHSFGMTWQVALFHFGIYLFVQAIIMSRCTAEGGLLITEGCFTPMDIYTWGDRQMLGARQLTLLSFLDGMHTRDLRGMLLTGLLDAQKVTEQARLRARKVFWMLVGGTLFAIAVALVVQMWLPYKYGAVNLYSYVYSSASIQFFRENAPFMGSVPTHREYPNGPLFTTIGALVCALLSYLRWRIAGFPLHPLGYAMAPSWGIVVFWFSMLVAWLIKVPLVRYGGMRTFRLLRPFFLGLIFGEFLAACMWSLIAWFWQLPTPTFPWP